MEQWILNALIALVLYGFWGFFPKLALRYISPQSALLYEVAGGILVAAALFAFTDYRPDFHRRGVFYGVLTGICGLLGTLFYFMASQRGNISLTVSVTALYPLITIFLATLILHEPLSIKQGAGIFLAIIAIILITS